MLIVPRIREAVQANIPIIDVDGSYLYRKRLRLGTGSTGTPTTLPPLPIAGCESVSAENATEMSVKIPHVTQGTCACSKTSFTCTCMIILDVLLFHRCPVHIPSNQ